MTAGPPALPAPKGWRFSPRIGWVRVGLYLLLGIGFAVGGTVLVVSGTELIRGYALLGGAFVFAAGSAMYWPGRRSTLPSAGADGDGRPELTLPMTRVPLVCSVAVGLGFAALATVIALDGRNGGVPRTFAALFGFFAVVILAFGAIGLARHSRAGGARVALTQDAVTVVAMGRRTSLAWEHLDEVVAMSVGVPFAAQAMIGLRADDVDNVVSDSGAFARKAMRMSRLLGAHIGVPVDSLAVDRTLAYWTLHHYATHPDDRAELADGRAVERAARGDLG